MTSNQDSVFHLHGISCLPSLDSHHVLICNSIRTQFCGRKGLQRQEEDSWSHPVYTSKSLSMIALNFAPRLSKVRMGPLTLGSRNSSGELWEAGNWKINRLNCLSARNTHTSTVMLLRAKKESKMRLHNEMMGEVEIEIEKLLRLGGDGKGELFRLLLHSPKLSG